MSDCCSNPNSKILFTCPECHTDCKNVSMRTLYHQIRFPENQELAIGSYYYCPAKNCSTAYFSRAGISIPKSLLVTQQALQKDMLCYCFDITSAIYLVALESHGSDSIKNFVIQRTKLAECACEIKNPAGLCCLAKFKQLEKESAAIKSVSYVHQ